MVRSFDRYLDYFMRFRAFTDQPIFRNPLRILIPVGLTCLVAACPAPDPPEGGVLYTYEIVAEYPHDITSFTQGLVVDDGELFEGTGRNGSSVLRRVDLETGAVLQEIALAFAFFGEGVTVFGDRIVQLTFLSRTGFVYDRDTFDLLETFAYDTQGWGITHDGSRLIMSDGSHVIRFLDPDTFEVTGSIEVFDDGEPLRHLNELEFVDGEIWANVWLTDFIVILDPDTGRINGRVDLTGLLDPADITAPVDVLNGIAYNETTGQLFVTGKLWPLLFEIRLVPE